ncbi:jg23242 [Pararge aegeria aegeria]|uniref:Jg23242 protein n=1 Tax=Pararge aegeria aegeria TaxID=348720 RepID=A0A8S4QSP1_9NEOP|nr:jg23242 [Pararge aegeria aegeria]
MSIILQVPVLYGAMVEGIATCLCRLASRSLSDLNPRYATAIDSFIGTSLVVAAFDYSGGYFNPVLATSLKAGCEGHTLMEHALVYWLGACAGSIISVYVYKIPSIQKYVKGTTEVNGDSFWAEKED